MRLRYEMQKIFLFTQKRKAGMSEPQANNKNLWDWSKKKLNWRIILDRNRLQTTGQTEKFPDLESSLDWFHVEIAINQIFLSKFSLMIKCAVALSHTKWIRTRIRSRPSHRFLKTMEKFSMKLSSNWCPSANGYKLIIEHWTKIKLSKCYRD